MNKVQEKMLHCPAMRNYMKSGGMYKKVAEKAFEAGYEAGKEDEQKDARGKKNE